MFVFKSLSAPPCHNLYFRGLKNPLLPPPLTQPTAPQPIPHTNTFAGIIWETTTTCPGTRSTTTTMSIPRTRPAPTDNQQKNRISLAVTVIQTTDIQALGSIQHKLIDCERQNRLISYLLCRSCGPHSTSVPPPGSTSRVRPRPRR